jgi:hypothetical protein
MRRSVLTICGITVGVGNIGHVVRFGFERQHELGSLTTPGPEFGLGSYVGTHRGRPTDTPASSGDLVHHWLVNEVCWTATSAPTPRPVPSHTHATTSVQGGVPPPSKTLDVCTMSSTGSTVMRLTHQTLIIRDELPCPRRRDDQASWQDERPGQRESLRSGNHRDRLIVNLSRMTRRLIERSRVVQVSAV